MLGYILCAASVIAVEIAILVIYDRLLRQREESEETQSTPRASGEEADFWQNIISYDHKKKGGE